MKLIHKITTNAFSRTFPLRLFHNSERTHIGANKKATYVMIQKAPKTSLETIETSFENGQPEARLASLLEKRINPYPNFYPLSADLMATNPQTSPSLETPSFRSSSYDFETLGRLSKRGTEPIVSDDSLMFNDIKALKERFSDIKSGDRLKDVNMVLAGRILSRRDASAKLIFYDVLVDRTKVQVVASLGNYRNVSDGTSFGEAHEGLKRGDIIRISGFVGKSNAGELSIFATIAPQLLAPCLPDMPLATQLGSLEQRFRKRPLSLLLHEHTARAIQIRAKVLRGIRRYLEARGFLEVETPILAAQAGGAAAKPFTTHCHALDLPLHLRISPELYLKQMVVGGFERVYELGRVFRNEGIDPSHNPEFTTCEFYLAYANLETLFQVTEDLLGEVVKDAVGCLEVETPEATINFQAPFRRLHIVDELTRQLGPLPPFDGPIEPWLDLCKSHEIPVLAPITMTRVLDALIGALIEPQCIQPTFLFAQPLVMSPLAKALDDSPLAARFELFIVKREFINAYEELNSPAEQLVRFETQSKDRDVHGDSEAHELNQDFCDALSYGLPPTAGWGLGVDRLVALLSQAPNIRSTLPFPLLRSINSPTDQG